MTRANARELAIHLIYGRDFTGEEPNEIISARLNKEYYGLLSDDNQVHSFYIPYLHKTNHIVPVTPYDILPIQTLALQKMHIPL